jgi:hypothetical protein
MFWQFLRAARHTALFQVGRAGAGNAHHVGQGCRYQAGIGQWPGTQHQIDFAQVRAMQVDEAVDQAQLNIQAWVGHQEISDCRRQMTASERGGRINANQAFRRVAQ